MIRIGTVRFSLLMLRRMAWVSLRPPCGGSFASQSRMSIFWPVSAFDDPERVSHLDDLVGPEAAQHAVHDHAQIRVRIGNHEEKITEIDGGIFHPFSLDGSVRRGGAAPGFSLVSRPR
jgi:hypothetical protein